VARYQKKHSLTHTRPDHQTSFMTPFTTIHSILLLTFMCLTVLFHNLCPQSPGPLRSSSWSGTLYLINYTPYISLPSLFLFHYLLVIIIVYCTKWKHKTLNHTQQALIKTSATAKKCLEICNTRAGRTVLCQSIQDGNFLRKSCSLNFTWLIKI